MVVQGSLGESVYTVGSALFPVLNVNEDDVREVFREKERRRTIVKIASNKFTKLLNCKWNCVFITNFFRGSLW